MRSRNGTLLVAADPMECKSPRAAPPESEEGVFTRYLRSLDSEEEPRPRAFGTLWQALRTALVAELRRRAAWSSPPSYFGIYGWESWQTYDSGVGRTCSALEELLTDCYTFIFLERLPRLRAQLVIKPNIDGLVLLYLRNYLYERRKRHDLLGFQVFQSLRQAVRQAVEAGELWVVLGDPRISNNTILSASPQADPADSISTEALAPIIEGWCHVLLPELVTAAGSRRRQVVTNLRRLLLDLEAAEASVVRFKDLIDHLKRVVRASWAAVFDLEEGQSAMESGALGFAEITRLVQPEVGVESHQSFHKLLTCVAELTERLGESERTRHYLRALWGFLRVWAAGEGTQRLPSGRALSTLLHIPRKRLPCLWKILRRQVRSCRTTLGSSNLEVTEDTCCDH